MLEDQFPVHIKAAKEIFHTFDSTYISRVRLALDTELDKDNAFDWVR